MFLMAVLGCLMQYTWAVAGEQPYQASINFWAGEPSISTTCEKIPFEPFEDADYQSTDYAVGLLFRELKKGANPPPSKRALFGAAALLRRSTSPKFCAECGISCDN